MSWQGETRSGPWPGKHCLVSSLLRPRAGWRGWPSLQRFSLPACTLHSTARSMWGSVHLLPLGRLVGDTALSSLAHPGWLQCISGLESPFSSSLDIGQPCHGEPPPHCLRSLCLQPTTSQEMEEGWLVTLSLVQRREGPILSLGH